MAAIGTETLAGGRAVNRLIFTTGSKRVELVCRQNTSVRSFHRTVAVYDDLTVVTSPPFADSITEGDMRWEKAVGDRVAADEMLGEIETDKTAMPVPSPVAGVVEELLVADGDTVTSGIPLCKIRPGGEAAASPPKPAESAKPKAPPPKEKPKPKQESSSSGPIPTSIPPSPPLPTKPIASVSPSSVKPIAAAALSLSSGGGRGETRVKMNRMRLRIAQRLKDSQNECAMLTTFNEIDLSNLMELRSKYKDAVFNKHGVKLGFMSAFLKASAHALQDQPTLNAVIDENEIVYRDYVDISVAVSTPKGLVVPVVRNVETMNFVDIERSINDLGLKARNNELAIEDMDGGTFTISNGGVYGSLFGTPIINPPQSAILGMHAIKDRAVVIGGKIEIRPMMWVALTYDHRLVDGREAVTFLIKIKNAVEDPRMLLLGL